MERKITSKSACSMTSQAIAKAGRAEKTPLYHIMGNVNGTKTIQTDYGESIGLRGTFEAIDAISGEVKKAPIYWPPAFIADVINGALLAGKGDANFAVEFAYTVGVAPDENSQMGYAYYVDELNAPDRADPFEKLRAGLPELAAPDTKAVEDKSAGKKADAKK